MNNASFHLSAHAAPGRHHLLSIPSSTGVPNAVARLLSASSDSPYTMATNNGNIMNSPQTSQISPLNFSQRDLLQFGSNNPTLHYLNSFGGMPMLPTTPFGMFPQYHNFFSKSPGIGSPAPGFFGGFVNSKG